MKITQKKLRQLIKEEMLKLLKEQAEPFTTLRLLKEQAEPFDRNKRLSFSRAELEKAGIPQATPDEKAASARRSDDWFRKNRQARPEPTKAAAVRSDPSRYARRIDQADIDKVKANIDAKGGPARAVRKVGVRSALRFAGPVGAIASALMPSETASTDSWGIKQEEILKYWPELSPEMVTRVQEYTSARDAYHGRRLGVPKRSIVNALTGPGGEVMVDDMRAKSQSKS